MSRLMKVNNLMKSVTGTEVIRSYDSDCVQKNYEYWKKNDFNETDRFKLYAALSKTLIETTYEDAPNQDEHLGEGVVAHRHNHGTSHAVRKQQTLIDNLDFVKTHGRAEFKEAVLGMTLEEVECMRLAAYLMRCGRTNERASVEDPSNNIRSGVIFKQIAIELGFKKELVETIAEMIANQSAPSVEEKKNIMATTPNFAGFTGTDEISINKARVMRRILDLTHNRDLIRLYKKGNHEDNIKLLTGCSDLRQVEFWRSGMDKQSIRYINEHGIQHMGIMISDVDRGRKVVIDPAGSMEQLSKKSLEFLPVELKLPSRMVYTQEDFNMMALAEKGKWNALRESLTSVNIDPIVIDYISVKAISDRQWDVLHLAEQRRPVDKYLPAAGPLPISYFTKQLEGVARLFMSGQSYSINMGLVKFETSEKIYDLREILKYANLEHLSLNENDFAGYETYQSTTAIHCSTYGYKRLNLLRKGMYSLLSIAEMQALNVYTGNAFSSINAMLRGSFNYTAKQEEVKDIFLHAVFAGSALAKMPKTTFTHTVRGEGIYSESVHASRIKASVNGAVHTVISPKNN